MNFEELIIAIRRSELMKIADNAIKEDMELQKRTTEEQKAYYQGVVGALETVLADLEDDKDVDKAIKTLKYFITNFKEILKGYE